MEIKTIMPYEKLKDHKQIAQVDGFVDRALLSDYALALQGNFDSPVGKRREMKPDEFLQYGEWQPCATAPEDGIYLLRGDYESDFGAWTDAVLPCWFEDGEWFPDYGEFTSKTEWMHLPWIPELWDFIEKRFARDNPNLVA